MRPNQIRLAAPTDVILLPAIERSAGKAFLTIPELAWIASDDVTSEAVHADRVQAGTTWVCEDEGRVMGFLSAERMDDDLHIWELAVSLDWQGRGAGRALMTQAIAYAAGEGLSSVTLTTFKDVPWNAPFYSSMGFKLVFDNVPATLARMLNEEAASGLPAESRCAMILTVAQKHIS